MLDRRLNAFRPDLVDIRLKDQVSADHFVDAVSARIVIPVAQLHARPDASSGVDTQLLHGETVRVFEQRDDWAWLQADRDSYVGYVPSAALGAMEPAPTHRVIVPRSFTYALPDMKTPFRLVHSLGSELAIVGEEEHRNTRYALLSDGTAMIARHLSPLGTGNDRDYVAIAETLEHTPYLWGGKSAFGIDCSGLVQLSMHMAGINVPRDTDMQLNAIGRKMEDATPMRRGDLIFWKGHVAIAVSDTQIIHANGYSMTVLREPLSEAISRIKPLYGKPLAIRRPEQA